VCHFVALDTPTPLVCHIRPEPLIRKLKWMLHKLPYMHGTTTSRPTTPHGNYLAIAKLYNAAIRQTSPVDWLIQQTPQYAEEQAHLTQADAASKHQRTE